jgi:hypothetical protein
MIPLRMAAVAAVPHMGVLVWIFGAGRYQPLNYRPITLRDEQIGGNPYPGSNYTQLVDTAVASANRHAFVTEYAKPTSLLGDTPELSPFRQRYPYVTRLYTRISPERMTLDPNFGPGGGGDVSNIHSVQPSTNCDPVNLAIGSLGTALGGAFYPLTCGVPLVLVLLIVLLLVLRRRGRRGRAA